MGWWDKPIQEWEFSLDELVGLRARNGDIICNGNVVRAEPKNKAKLSLAVQEGRE